VWWSGGAVGGVVVVVMNTLNFALIDSARFLLQQLINSKSV